MRMRAKSGMDVARYLASNTSPASFSLSAFGRPVHSLASRALLVLSHLSRTDRHPADRAGVNAALAKLDAGLPGVPSVAPAPQAGARPRTKRTRSGS